MINAVIIEDEKASLEHLVQLLADTDPGIHVSAIITSVREGRNYFSGSTDAHIIFSDIQLTDGHSFEIFSNCHITAPVIFITGYNEYMMNAFTSNGIDYLLKPVSHPELKQALDKYHMLEDHFGARNGKMESFYQQLEPRKKSRLIVRKGLEFLALNIDEVVLMYTENKLVYVVDKWGKKYMMDKNLAEMEDDLDPKMFFRANRQYIINVQFIKGFRSYEKVKLQVEMSVPSPRHEIIISQEQAAGFRKWMYEG